MEIILLVSYATNKLSSMMYIVRAIKDVIIVERMMIVNVRKLFIVDVETIKKMDMKCVISAYNDQQ